MYSDRLLIAPQPLAIESGLLELPLAGATVRAGFPSPAEDFAVDRLDLASILITHPQATYFIGVRGDSMQGVGIFDRDLLVVNRALRPTHNDVVVAVIDGEFTCKTYWRRNGRVKLVAANPTFPDIVPKDGQVIEVWGVVTATIKRFRQGK
ncbi:translesion error-prone DNA polymerase V autoproteolytic subunit [Acidovorax sp. LjRoot129]|uniref:LexA family protein n=1 Tax=unclassified Acidovorax TaxID=2684926 RepID=UPI003ED10418